MQIQFPKPLDNKKRSLRLQKKLHVGQFRKFFFHIKILLKEALSEIEELDLSSKIILEVIEPNGMSALGVLTDEFSVFKDKGNITEQDYLLIKDWCMEEPHIHGCFLIAVVDQEYPDLIEEYHKVNHLPICSGLEKEIEFVYDNPHIPHSVISNLLV